MASSSRPATRVDSNKLDVVLLSLVVVCFVCFYSGSLHWSYTVVDVVASSSSKAPTAADNLLDKLEHLLLSGGVAGPTRHHKSTTTSILSQIPKLVPSELRLPTPILVMGLDQVGSTAIQGYFQCGLVDAANEVAPYRKDVYDGVAWDHDDSQQEDVIETVLQDIHNQFPNATWILNTRDELSWLHSVNDNPLLLKNANKKDDAEKIALFRRQTQRVKEFVGQHPSHHLVPVQTDGFEAGQIMENAFGIPKECWGHDDSTSIS
ncbi:expressed unknown protein [Seminavis robusta]|uniref:Uncharacterized protein n=1 Tax=Seminavis robusta TaxID=568900 RepID=A0A9N8E4I7_9STRA|nr:expressed unknown protein [Seminavis robusta]|eukprot:Sro658_g182770.1 n/a (263) ;mRNA; r:36859-37647